MTATTVFLMLLYRPGQKFLGDFR